MQTAFYETLPKLREVDQSKADFAFFIYDLILDKKLKTYTLKLQRVVYTEFASVLKTIAKFEAGPMSEFTKTLQKKLDKKRSGVSEIESLEDIVVE